MTFKDLKEYEAFHIEGVDENLVKVGGNALRYDKLGAFLGRLEMSNETEVVSTKGENDAT